ncbi:uncharacterized protein MELLADRAFT_76364 [Melampsora larici-populina 98AG31]|uniref:Enhancer of mRNA-decapping protein 3 n=1 Tax=Melampsora larici-populina (strain 98AG31 / pathotype 3-4-7) TaxID=747676 RepID=F4R4I1_MELLP|nr:uncharacterized protein MELLADRAFT_76364 [Melampsora larici-populina 98AG31]EGG12996.1 hypothetical protein MELLADRAFT_76364 [Melampsora larici-populina 98AG31]
MSSHFVGLPISVELSNGNVVQGVVSYIDQANGKLHLKQARLCRFDGTLSSTQDDLVVDKDSVKDLTLLSVRPSNSPLTNNPINQSTRAQDPNQTPHLARHASEQISSAHSGPQIVAQSERHSSNLPHPSTNSTPESDHLGDSVATLTSPAANSRTKVPRRRRKPVKAHQQRASHLAVSFQEVSTGGESSFSAREDTDGAPSPPLSPGASADYESNPTQTKSDFSKDFDFQAGLQAFDKAKLWAEIALVDATDPADRLVAYNRKKPISKNGASYETPRSRNLGPNEMVLSAQEQAVNGVAVASPSLQANQISTPSRLISTEGRPVYPVTFERLNQAFNLASVEYGPNLVQRIENGARSIAQYIINLLRRRHGQNRSMIESSVISFVVSCNANKGSSAVRAATLLANKGYTVCLVLANAYGDRAHNGTTNGTAYYPELPSSPMLIVEALAENSISHVSDQRVINQDLLSYIKRAPILSIDTPSYVNYDTGEFLVNQDLIPKSQHLICLAAIPQGIVEHPNRPNEICLADLTLPSICWNEENGEKKPGEEKRRVPSVWGDDWIMMLNF